MWTTGCGTWSILYNICSALHMTVSGNQFNARGKVTQKLSTTMYFKHIIVYILCKHMDLESSYNVLEQTTFRSTSKKLNGC